MRKTNLKKLRKQLLKVFNEGEMEHYKNNEAYDSKFEFMTEGPFGLCASNPVQLQGNHRVDAYLSMLEHHDSTSLRFVFSGYETAANLNLQAEVYKVLDEYGDEISMIYLCTGAVLDSEQVPDGFYIAHSSSIAA